MNYKLNRLAKWFIKFTPTDELCKGVLKYDGMIIRYIKEQTEEMCLIAIKQNAYSIEYINNQTDNVCKMALNIDGNVLQYIKNQNYNLCLLAINNDPRALKYVKNQDYEICLFAINQYNKLFDKLHKSKNDKYEKGLHIIKMEHNDYIDFINSIIGKGLVIDERDKDSIICILLLKENFDNIVNKDIIVKSLIDRLLINEEYKNEFLTLLQDDEYSYLYEYINPKDYKIRDNIMNYLDKDLV